MTDERGRTSLTPFAPGMRDMDPDGWKVIGAKLWHDKGIAVIGPNQLRSSIDQTYIEQCAERLYGKRNKGTQDG